MIIFGEGMGMSTVGDEVRPVFELSEEILSHLIRQLNGRKTPRETLALWYAFCRLREIIGEADSILAESDVPDHTRFMEHGRKYAANVTIRAMHDGLFNA